MSCPIAFNIGHAATDEHRVIVKQSVDDADLVADLVLPRTATKDASGAFIIRQHFPPLLANSQTVNSGGVRRSEKHRHGRRRHESIIDITIWFWIKVRITNIIVGFFTRIESQVFKISAARPARSRAGSMGNDCRCALGLPKCEQAVTFALASSHSP